MICVFLTVSYFKYFKILYILNFFYGSVFEGNDEDLKYVRVNKDGSLLRVCISRTLLDEYGIWDMEPQMVWERAASGFRL